MEADRVLIEPGQLTDFGEERPTNTGVLVSDTGTRRYLCRNDAGQIIGGLLLGRVRIQGKGLTAFVYKLLLVCVLPEYQRQGIATWLYKRARFDVGRSGIIGASNYTPAGLEWARRVGLEE